MEGMVLDLVPYMLRKLQAQFELVSDSLDQNDR